MSSFDYDELLLIVAFLVIVWGTEKFVVLIGLSPIIGSIFGGILCGPNGINIVPWWCDQREEDWCEGVTPFVMLGQIGVTFMIAESGTHFDYDKVKKVFGRAFLVALLGTFIPLVWGMFLFAALSFPMYPDGFAAGAALAPTSVGIAITLLTENKQLNSIAGQTIVTAAFIDDVFSLVILVVLLKLAEGNINPWALLEPFLFSFIFLGLGTWLTVKVWPTVIHDWLLGSIKERRHLNHQPRDMVHLGLMLAFLVLLGWVGAWIGSHLLGAFIAGMSFSGVPRSHYVWRRQMKRVNAWCIRMFFAATVGFVVPVSVMFTPQAVWQGALVALTATVIGKVAAGLHTGEYRWVIGFAMVGRGEFAYLVAETSKSTCYNSSGDTDHDRRLDEVDGCNAYLMSEEVFAVVVWALLLATIVAPSAFSYVLKKAFAGKTRSGIEQFMIKAEGPHHTGMHFEIADVLHSLHLDVIEAKTESDGVTVFGTWMVQVTDLADELDIDKIHEIEHMIKEAVNCEDTQISIGLTETGLQKDLQLTPPNRSPRRPSFDFDKNIAAKHSKRNIEASPLPLKKEPKHIEETWLEIRIMAMHDKSIITEVLETLDEVGLHIMKGHTEEHHQHEEEVYFAKSGNKGTVSTDQTRQALKAIFNKHHMKAQIMVKRINAADVIQKNFETSNHISMSTRNVLSLQTHAVIDDLEEGYEITIEVDHAERDPHLVAHLARTLTNHKLDVTSFDMSEAADPDQTHVTVNLFVRRVKGKAPDKRTQKLIKSIITQYFKTYSLDVKTFRIIPITAQEAQNLSKSVKKTDSIQAVDEMVRQNTAKYLQDCMMPLSPKQSYRPYSEERIKLLDPAVETARPVKRKP